MGSRRGMEQAFFDMLEVNRGRTLEIIHSTEPRLMEIVPPGFANHLHWHIGHILTTQERLAFRFIGEPLELDEQLMRFFLNGTKPADWAEPAPDIPELAERLKEQPARIRRRLSGKWDQPLAMPFKSFSTLGEVLLFSLSHEGLHQGYMMALRRAAAAVLER